MLKFVPFLVSGLTGSALDHRSLPSEFEYRRGHSWMVFHLRLLFITFGGRSAHLACYNVHKSGRKRSNIIIIMSIIHNDRSTSTINFPLNWLRQLQNTWKPRRFESGNRLFLVHHTNHWAITTTHYWVTWRDRTAMGCMGQEAWKTVLPPLAEDTHRLRVVDPCTDSHGAS